MKFPIWLIPIIISTILIPIISNKKMDDEKECSKKKNMVLIIIGILTLVATVLLYLYL
jgi:peptidoglycan biosynthesis protein MviN/MurJ (putative lipid II flippase)